MLHPILAETDFINAALVVGGFVVTIVVSVVIPGVFSAGGVKSELRNNTKALEKNSTKLDEATAAHAELKGTVIQHAAKFEAIGVKFTGIDKEISEIKDATGIRPAIPKKP